MNFIKKIISFIHVMVFIFITIALCVIKYYDFQIDNKTFNIEKNISDSNLIIDNTNSYIQNDKFNSYIPYSEIPQGIINAFISAEDKNFFTHKGIDFIAIFKAIIEYVYYNRDKLRGASTITQQLVKNIIIENDNRTLSRKIKEAIIAFRITKRFSKEKILEIYLNTIYLGNQTSGISQASKFYFNKSVLDLNTNEMAYLAILPKAPSYYNLINKPEKANIRKNWVLKKMMENEYINYHEYDKYIAQDLKYVDNKNKNNIDKSNNIQYFNQYIDKFIDNILPERKSLKIFTTINKEMQDLANYQLNQGINNQIKKLKYKIIKSNENIDNFQSHHINNNITALVISINSNEINLIIKNDNEIKEIVINKKYQYINNLKVGDVIEIVKNNDSYEIATNTELNGGVIIAEIKTGKILAMVGGVDYNKSQFNRVSMAKRQPGSLFKPIVIATAFEMGYSPNDIILDIPINIKNNNDIWSPLNYSRTFSGPITIRRAIELSKNLAIINLSYKIGLKNIHNKAVEMNVNDKFSEVVPSLALGSNETTLIDIVYAYIALANNGKYINPFFINKIKSVDNKLLYKNPDIECIGCEDFNSYNKPIIIHNKKQLIDERSAFQVLKVLNGVALRGTGEILKKLGNNVYGKTGTTNKGKDTWFIGFDSKYIVGVYIGYDTPISISNYASGSSIASPIVFNILKKIHTKEDFKAPKGLIEKNIDLNTGNYLTYKECKNTSTCIKEFIKEEKLKSQEDMVYIKNKFTQDNLNINDYF